MRDERDLFRRGVLAKGAALGVLIAGCSGTDQPTETSTPGPTATSTGVGGGTNTPSETSTGGASALERFDYPAGATIDGIAAAELVSTHEATVLGAGSATLRVEGRTRYGDRTVPADQFGVFDGTDVYRRDRNDQLATRTWSPADETVSYVRMDANDRRRYRIDERSLEPRQAARVALFEALLAGGAWSEATEVVETFEGEAAVRYEATGVADETQLLGVLSGDAVTGFEATAVVTASGYVHEVAYDLGVRRGEETVRRSASATAFSLGETDVPEPSWAGEAEREGVRFEGRITSTLELVQLKMVNGATLPPSTKGRLTTAGRTVSGTIGESISAGDTLYLGIGTSGGLAAGVNDQAIIDQQLGEQASVVLELDRFTVYRGTVTLR